MGKIHLDIEMTEASAISMLTFFHQQFEIELKNLPEPKRSLLLEIRSTIKKLEAQINGSYEESKLATFLTLTSGGGDYLTNGEKSNGKAYDLEGSKFQNSLYAMNRTGKLMTTRQIIELWIDEDPTFLERENVTIGEMQGKLSSTLKQKTDNKNKIYRVKSEFSEEYLYGLLEWFDNKFEPKIEYMPAGYRRYEKIKF